MTPSSASSSDETMTVSVVDGDDEASQQLNQDMQENTPPLASNMLPLYTDAFGAAGAFEVAVAVPSAWGRAAVRNASRASSLSGMRSPNTVTQTSKAN